MKFLRHGPPGFERPGVLDEQGRIRDLSTVMPDLSGDYLDPEFTEGIALLDLASMPVVDDDARIGPCVGQVGKFIGIGINYHDLAAESETPTPVESPVFLKATSSIIGPYDDIVLPRNSQKTDWEVELGVIIGKKAKYINVEQSFDYIGGYCVINDLSERTFQLDGSGQWTKGKSCDTFGPIGPWLVTKDEIPDPQCLTMWLKLNGQIVQHGSSKTMITGIASIVAYLSQFMTLHPGDIISTGTVPGLGMNMTPPRYLKAGDRVELGIDGLGVQSHDTKAD